MARLLGLAITALFAASLMEAAGCKRSETSTAVPDGATASAASSGALELPGQGALAAGADAAGVGEGSTAIFSLPIAGARVAAASGGAISVIGAGLSVATHSVIAARIDGAGKIAWTRLAIPDVAWSADAELHAWPIAAGAALVWRGPAGKGKKSTHVAVVLAPDGHVVDGPLEVGSLVCATDDGLAWSEETPDRATRVRLRTYAIAPAAPHDDTSPGTTDDFTLTCGSHRAYAVVEGDEGSPTKVFAIGGAGEKGAEGGTFAPTALGRDEERDLFPWADGDDLGFVRVANGGEVQAATFHSGALSLLHAGGARVLPEDDVVGVDADARQVVLVTTHDESDACPDGRGGSSVHALRIARDAGGHGATSLRLAPSACGKDVGPFWTNTLRRSLVVAWPERTSRPEKGGAPITALAFHLLEDGAATTRIVQAADGLADAGCDENRCYAIALAREPGADGSKPEAIKVIVYP